MGPDRASSPERVVRWVHETVRFTPDRHDTYEAVLAERKGNCADHAALVWAMLCAQGIESRFVRELNVQPASPERAASAARSRSSLFGLEHNDHTWLEVRSQRRWIPADSSLGIFGSSEWVRTRLLTGIPQFGMIVPFTIVAYAQQRPVDRTETYLLNEFSSLRPSVRETSAWPGWKSAIRGVSVSGFEALTRGSAIDTSRVHRVSLAIEELRRVTQGATTTRYS